MSTTTRRTQRERSTASAKSLIAAAIELIAEQGFEKTTAAQIGERAGYSREMVRHRYGSKERLLEVLLEEEHKNLLLLAPEAQEGDGRSRALAQVGQWRDVAQREPEQLLAFLVLCFEAVGPIPNLAPWMRNWFAEYRAQLSGALRDGIADGSVDPDLDAETEATDVAYYGIGLCFSFVLHRELSEFVAAFDRLDGRLGLNWQP